MEFAVYIPEQEPQVGHAFSSNSHTSSSVIVPAAYRGRGYGSQGLALLCEAARANGVARLWDDIAIDDPAVRLFLRSGFREVERTKAYILVAKDL